MQVPMNMINQMANNYLNNQIQMSLKQMETKLQQVNPQMYQLYQTARQQNANPEDIFKQITANYDETTKQRFKQQGKQFGLSDELLNKI